jgi:hypothetical protein
MKTLFTITSFSSILFYFILFFRLIIHLVRMQVIFVHVQLGVTRLKPDQFGPAVQVQRGSSGKGHPDEHRSNTKTQVLHWTSSRRQGARATCLVGGSRSESAVRGGRESERNLDFWIPG